MSEIDPLLDTEAGRRLSNEPEENSLRGKTARYLESSTFHKLVISLVRAQDLFNSPLPLTPVARSR
jgi:hypothetical protein